MLSPTPQRLLSAAQEFGLRLVVLFGSQAKGHPEPGPESDIDVAVYGCPPEKYWECYEAIDGAFGGGELDLVRLEDADPLFRYEIMQSGILLEGDPDFFCEYRAYAYRDFIDSADLFALEKTLFEKKMARLRKQLNDSP
ncbi:type VII toxin-antitoxin system MntA family adenylyltransferase antitoxin [Nitrosococcus wardiae]|uniref:Nucleotidyltransferase domain-containing protein n=1 Tax=Nitrosococcus wardiae TaxID=1814290 RepID=A0A4V1AWA7_9GAMM|nr:nucleotidyltransferase domain-containing protein [Nitrosococcus wardiae]QBQ55975.1 nucleotidyltransferase domain-containing protein [Nitrosococcus wardiae]